MFTVTTREERMHLADTTHTQTHTIHKMRYLFLSQHIWIDSTLTLRCIIGAFSLLIKFKALMKQWRVIEHWRGVEKKKHLH